MKQTGCMWQLFFCQCIMFFYVHRSVFTGLHLEIKVNYGCTCIYSENVTGTLNKEKERTLKYFKSMS